MKAYVVGGSGYTGREVLRILSKHPEIDGIQVSSTRFEGKPVSELHPDLNHGLVFSRLDFKDVNSCDIAFCCVPHRKAMGIVPNISAKVVDLSADFRLKDAGVYEKFYGVKHSCPGIASKAVYGLPEYYREKIKKARIIANPGCYPTGAILACKPLFENFDVEHVIVDAKSGVSGAGREKEEELRRFVSDENMRAYKIVGHQHTPEIEQELGVKVSFTPHLAPLSQGIFTTVHAVTDADADEVKKVYEKKYKKEPFVKLADAPDLLSVRNTNTCQIGGFASDGRRLVITSTIDNLVKGASGQAVQNMNLMLGFDEAAGLVK
ncbi:MAG: N-acetyl-gamma-glutamyl-phosphate reductase [Candidatus Altiarchaeota archaeon]